MNGKVDDHEIFWSTKMSESSMVSGSEKIVNDEFMVNGVNGGLIMYGWWLMTVNECQ